MIKIKNEHPTLSPEVMEELESIREEFGIEEDQEVVIDERRERKKRRRSKKRKGAFDLTRNFVRRTMGVVSGVFKDMGLTAQMVNTFLLELSRAIRLREGDRTPPSNEELGRAVRQVAESTKLTMFLALLALPQWIPLWLILELLAQQFNKSFLPKSMRRGLYDVLD